MRLLGIIIVLILTGLQGVSQNVYRWYQDGKVIFQLEPNAAQPKAFAGAVEITAFPQISKIQDQYRITAVKQLHPNIADARLRRTYQIEFAEVHLVDQLVETVSQWTGVSFAEKKEIHETFLTPNDPYFTNSTNNGQWALFQINAEQAWDISTGSSNIVVAVTDNAINTSHPDLTNKLVQGRDVVDNDNDPSGCGSNTGFHGSHVSGIVGAETNNNQGIASIGFDVSIMPVKIGDCNGSLTGGYDGIIWAADNGADVINMSWGGGGQSNYGQQVCDYAWNAGSILIAAAGNNGSSQQFYPAAYNNVVSVASSTTGDAKSGFSQYGTWIDITAPGSSILSCDDGNSYQVTQGTSMASPLVAGLVGLMKSHAPSAPNTNIVNCLLSTADDIDAANPNYIGQLGSGRINAEQALICMNQYTYSLDVGIANIDAPIGNICSGTITPEIVLQNYGSNAVTSVTIDYDIGGAPQTYNWTGNLAQGASTVITLPTMTPGAGSFTFTATTSSPNGNTDQNTSNDSDASTFTTITNGQEVDLTIITDCYGSEITWDIVDGGGNTVASGGPYTDITGGATYVETICLASGCYTFNINDTYGDGLFGSQWTCTVDGDYYMEDNTGAQLFAMTAPNGDFGNGTSHTFCVSSNVSDDAGISSVTSPSGSYCATSVTPEVILNNYGTNSLTSVDILYDIGGTVQTYNWTGSLAAGANTTVTLPAMTVANGGYTFTATTDNPNGTTDGNPGNDQSTNTFSVFTSSTALPFVEDFETNSFTSNDWTISNADNGITWEIVTVAGTTPGDKAAKMDFYNYGNGSERDGMQTPPLDFSTHSGVSMTYEHAFRRYNTNSADSMIIYVSTDCGNTWDRIVEYAEDGTGSFATAVTSTVEFDPAGSSEWCMGTVGANCFSVDLSAYDGQSSVIVKFESFNNGIAGNNLFIDNINIDGTPVNMPPSAEFTASSTSVCDGETVTFTDNSTNNPTSWAWDFGDGNNSTQQNPSHTYASPGTYTVTLTATNNFGSDVYTQTITVNAIPTVTASAANTSLCESASSEPLVGSPTGGTWTGTGTSGSNFDPGVAGAGTHTATYLYTDGNGCSSNDQVTFTVIPNPTVSMTGPTNTLCVYSPVETLTGSPSGGTFAGPGVSGSDFDPAVAGAGTHTITYEYTDGNGCIGQDAITITVSNCTGVEEVENGNVTLYPNPNNGAFMIKGLEPGTQYEVYTATGRLVLRGQVNSDLENISLESAENGNYFIRTIGEDRVGVVRFSVSR